MAKKINSQKKRNVLGFVVLFLLIILAVFFLSKVLNKAGLSDHSFQVLYSVNDRYQKPADIFVSNLDGSVKNKVVDGNNNDFRYSLTGNGSYLSRTNGNLLEVASTQDFNFQPITTIELKNTNLSQASLSLDGKYFWYVTIRNLLPVPQGLGDPLEKKIYLYPVGGGENMLVKSYQTKAPMIELVGVDVEKNESYWKEYCFECEGKVYVENLKNGNRIRETNKNYAPFWKSPKVFTSDFSKAYYFTYENELIEYDLLTNTPKALYGFSGLDPETSPFVDLFLTKDNTKLYLLKSQDEENSSLYVFSLPDGEPILLEKSLPIRFSNYVTFSPLGEYLWYTNNLEERIFDTRTKKDYLFFAETARKERNNINPTEMIMVIDNGISFLGWIPR